MTTGKVSFRTVEYMQRLISELDEANTQLRLEAESIAAEERVKILAFLRDETQIMAATVQAQNTLLEAAAKIEAGRHLK
jgi:hypothetical protein